MIEDKSVFGTFTRDGSEAVLHTGTVPSGELWYFEALIVNTESGGGVDSRIYPTGDTSDFPVAVPRAQGTGEVTASADIYMPPGTDFDLMEIDGTAGGDVTYLAAIRRIL